MSPFDSPLLVADIGGTNARLGVAQWDAQRAAVSITAIETLHSTDYANLGDLLEAYLQHLDNEPPRNACLAVAAALQDNIGTLTNIGWHLDGNALAQRLKLKHVQLLNDFGALAYSVPFLTTDEVLTLRDKGPTAGPISVLGAGTGFGAALLIPNKNQLAPNKNQLTPNKNSAAAERTDFIQSWNLVTTEGGHASFAPTSRREQQVWEFLRGYERHVCIEHILSGSGLVNIYRALTDSTELVEANEISQRALDRSDPRCVETVDVFCEIFGSVAGNIALTQGARGGVYIGGGVLPKLLPLLSREKFMARFDDKGIMSGYVKPLPIRLITAEYPALTGAAMWFWQSSGE